MAPLVMFLKNALRSLHQDERAQDAFEYLLVIGGVSVAIILAIATPIGSTLINAVVEGVCDAINAIPVGESPTFGLDCAEIVNPTPQS
jgi:Flp pilus assembly pilin Flp